MAANTNQENMQRRNYFLSKVIIDALKAKAAKSGTPEAEHVRAALSQYLKLEDDAPAN